MKILKSSLAFLFSLAIAGCMTTQTAPTIAAKADGSCSTSPGVPAIQGQVGQCMRVLAALVMPRMRQANSAQQSANP